MNTNLAFDVVVTAFAVSHILTMALITAWFGLKKPKSWAEVRRNFMHEYEGLRSRWKAS